MTTRCKFACQSVTKARNWHRGPDDPEFVYSARFSAVTDGSEENKKFFHFTPSGMLEIATYKEDIFTPGKSYYLDILEAVEPPKA